MASTEEGICTGILWATAPPSFKPLTTTASLEDIPALVEQMCESNGEKSVAAVKQIYVLCDVFHKDNRIPMVCSGKYDVLTPLGQYLLTNESGDGRHLACLALNNLSIPAENKREMALGPASKLVIGGLCKVLGEDKPGSYLCSVCLLNISFLKESITTILNYAPPDPDGKEQTVLDNPNSLLCVLEKVVSNSPPSATKSTESTSKKSDRSSLLGSLRKLFSSTSKRVYLPDKSSEAPRWACGLIKNLARNKENAALIGKTDIPKCIVKNLRASTTPPSQWASNSLEDFSLFVVLNLSQWPVSHKALIRAGAVHVVTPILGERDGLQGLKAAMACANLEADWAVFPDGGEPAAASVTELMSNIVQKKGKDGLYACDVFQLYTATKAYRDLVRAASKADRNGLGDTNIKVLASPSAVALLLQIVSDSVTSPMDDGDANDTAEKFVPDALSVEYAVGALEALLPALSPRKSAEINQVLLTYANRTGSTMMDETEYSKWNTANNR